MLDPLRAELELLKRLRADHIAAKRFYSVQAMARCANLRFDWLDTWVARDRKRWHEAVGVASRARNRRRHFYRELARNYTAIVIEPLDLKRAAAKIDQATGERSDFTRKARSGRTVLFDDKSSETPFVSIDLDPEMQKRGYIWHAVVEDVGIGQSDA